MEVAAVARVRDSGEPLMHRRFLSSVAPSIRARLWFVVLLVSLPALLVSCWLIILSYRNERRAMERHLTTTVQAYSSLLEADFRERVSMLQSLAMSTRLSSGDLTGFRLLAQRLVTRPGEWVVLTELDGRELVHTRDVRLGEMTPIEVTPELRSAMERRVPYASNLQRNRGETRHYFYIAHPVSIGGDREGILYLGVTPAALTRSLLSNRLTNAGIVAVADRERTIVVRSRGQETFVGGKGSDTMRRASAEGREGVFESITLEGVPSLAAFHVSPQTGWVLVMAVHKSELFDPAKQMLLIALTVSGLVGVAVGLIVWWVNRSTEKIADALVGDTQAVARGERVEARRTGVIEADIVSRALADTSHELAARQAALEQARDTALAASKAKDEFLAALSHELRTPLNPVLLLASDAARDPSLPADVRETFETIEKHVLQEARLIDDLLDVTRIGSGKLNLHVESLDLDRIVQESIEIVRPRAAEKQQQVELNLGTMGARVRGDSVRLHQIFTNLVGNAVKFTPRSGRITVSSRMQPHDRTLVVEVADSGIGMSPAEVERVFERFVQGDHAGTGRGSPYGGLGLGLAIARSLVELHGGRIEAASEGLGKGAVFTVWLPEERGT